MTWDRKLSPPITLSDGRTLSTLRSAAKCLIATFDGISHWPALEHARDLLMTAAASGRRKDIAAATDQVVIVIEQRKLRGLTFLHSNLPRPRWMGPGRCGSLSDGFR